MIIRFVDWNQPPDHSQGWQNKEERALVGSSHDLGPPVFCHLEPPPPNVTHLRSHLHHCVGPKLTLTSTFLDMTNMFLVYQYMLG